MMLKGTRKGFLLSKKFFYREIEEIRKQEIAAITPQEYTRALQRKTQLLLDFERYHAFEQSIKHSTSMVRIASSVTVSITLGVTLNTNNLTAFVVAIILFFIRFSSLTGRAAANVYRYTSKVPEVFWNQAKDREFFEQRDGGGVVRSGSKLGVMR
jgi:hypothetical protein